jgi:deazaflavin-dependent oxidoreductase (nitroreductase family)
MADLSSTLAELNRSKTVVLTHYGRKSGKPYEVTIWFTVEGDHVNLQTMNVKRQWVQNVSANGKVSLRIGSTVLDGEARPVVDEAEMARVAELMGKKYLVARPYLWLKKRPDGAFHVKVTVRG